MSEVQLDTDASVKFLQQFAPEGPWVLTAIKTDKKMLRGKTFNPGQEAALRKWLTGQDKGDEWNIYFHVNTPYLNRNIKIKAEKQDIEFAKWLYVDVDAQEGFDLQDEFARILGQLTNNLPKGIPEPTVITYSGGGYQAFWRIDGSFPINGTKDNWEKYESFNKRLEQVFQADHCHNVERIMRLPGTVNNPDPKKAAKGRVRAMAQCIAFNSNTYDLELKFKAATGTQTGKNSIENARGGSESDLNMKDADRQIMDMSELDDWDVPNRVKVIIAQGSHPEETKKGDNSRSAWVFDVVCNMIRKKVPHGIIYSILMDKDWTISSSILESKDPHRYAIRQILNAIEFTKDENTFDMNKRHAVIGSVGGSCKVIEEVYDQVLGRTSLVFSSFQDVKNRYDNKRVVVGKTADDTDKTIGLGTYWLRSEDRSQYDGITFAPESNPSNMFNLWRGFNYSPHPGDCDLYLQHIRDNICAGKDEYYEYLIKWMAKAVQNPASQGEVAIVLQGGKGTGKSFFAHQFGQLFGRHYLPVTNANHLVGQFNAHLKDAILLFADEAFFAGDKKHEAVLKGIVTESTFQVEAKHVDAQTYPNYIHLIMAGNDQHLVRASGDERRYFVLEVGTGKQQNSDYFGAIKKQMENGGYEALLFHLQSVDLSEFNVRSIPATEALQKQKDLSLDPLDSWWLNCLQTGHICKNDNGWKEFHVREIWHNQFWNDMKIQGVNSRKSSQDIGTWVNGFMVMSIAQKRVHEEYMGDDGRPISNVKKKRVDVFGTLKKCRAEWEAKHGPTVWEHAEDDELIQDPF